MEYKRNSVGIKISTKVDPQELTSLLDILDTYKQDIGRVSLITRLGNAHVEQVLPSLTNAVKASGYRPIWMYDPCHGCTEKTSSGIKTRRVLRVLDELERTLVVHRRAT